MSDRDRNVDLEAVYAALAEGIDAHGPEHARCSLPRRRCCWQRRSATRTALAAIADAQRNMTGMRRPTEFELNDPAPTSVRYKISSRAEMGLRALISGVTVSRTDIKSGTA